MEASRSESILVVEDDENILELIRYHLNKEGYRVTCLTTGEKVLLSAGLDLPDLILLDLMLPGIDGIEVCKILKQEEKTRAIPIIMVTAKGEEEDIITGLESGADDYISKPFSPRVLLARVQAVLRRKSRESEGTDQDMPIRIDDLHIDPMRHKVMIGERIIDLTLSEFKILHFLARRPGWVYTRYQIVEAIRGSDYHVTDRAVDVIIFGLRKKLGALGKYIQTVRGIGYRFTEDNIRSN